MNNVFCPKCNALKNMISTTTESNEEDSKGKLYKVITISYNCNTCHTFVKSEDERIPLNGE